MLAAKIIRSKTGAYKRIIEIRIPIRFYWDTNNEYDGLEIGPIPKDASRYSKELIKKVINNIDGLSGEVNNDETNPYQKAASKAQA